MGWDLVPVSRADPFQVAWYAWLHLVCSALEYSGADKERFNCADHRDNVHANAASAWEDSLEKGVGNLKVAIIHHSGGPPFEADDAISLVHS